MNRHRSTIAPFSPGETTNHHPGDSQVIAFPVNRDFEVIPTLHSGTELGVPVRLKRDSPRSITTWPLQRNPLTEELITVFGVTLATYLSMRVRVVTSVQGRTRTGKLRFVRISLFKTQHNSLRFTRPPNPPEVGLKIVI